MNVAYNQINCSDASRIIGVDYSTVVRWCRDGKINATNISEGTEKGRYVITETEVDYLKTLKQKFGRHFIRRYRKDWERGRQPATPEQETKPIAILKDTSANTNFKPIETNEKADIDELAIKIGYIQDLKDKLASLELEKAKLSAQLDALRQEVLEYL